MMKNPWISQIIDDPNVLTELTSAKVKTVTKDARCAICKGSKFLCGKSRCPILVRFYAQVKTRPLIDSLTLEGSSPPSVFVGRIGWPYVSIGPLIPPIHGDTSLLDTPELWVGKTIDDIVNFRSQLVRGKHRVHVKNINQGKIVELTRELALSKNSTEVDAEFIRKPTGRLVLDDEVQPFGPSAPLKNLNLSSIKTDQKIEKAFSDTDLKAAEAVLMLYQKGVLISKIQRAFSAGLFGIEKNRRFVPTCWSITAVDSIISQNLLEQVKTFPLINEFRVYEHVALDNRWIVLMVPGYWSYELIEAWYPKTVWNPSSSNTVIFSDYEGFEGRTTYPSIGGCWFASRVSISQALMNEKRQATVIVLREAHPGYILPVGVWNVRENVRKTLENNPLKFDKLEDALKYISTKLDIPLKEWIKNSYLLRYNLNQRRLSEYTS
jgi:hypothetical protein